MNMHGSHCLNDFVQDPLGIAVMKTLNVATSFDYDHKQDIPEGESPDVHRLRSRAAKSAVRRSREIYNPESAREYLQNIDDPIERAQAAIALKGDAQNEISYMANELMRLLPIGSDAPPGMPPLEFEPSGDIVNIDGRAENKRKKLSKTFTNGIADPSTWTTNKPKPRTMEVKDESNDDVIRSEYGENAVNDPIFRDMISKNINYDTSPREVVYDDSDSSPSISVRDALMKDATENEQKSTNAIDDQDVYYV